MAWSGESGYDLEEVKGRVGETNGLVAAMVVRDGRGEREERRDGTNMPFYAQVLT